MYFVNGVFLLDEMMQDYWFRFVRSADDAQNEPQKNVRLWSFFYETTAAVVAAVAILFFVFTFCLRVVGVQGVSMEPTLHEGEWLAVSTASDVRLYDIVILAQPNTSDKPLVKRVIAMGGQTVNIDPVSHVLTVDDKIPEKPVFDSSDPSAVSEVIGDMQYPLTVPQGKVFVLGDNRNNSKDSRFSSIGLIDEHYILGVVKYRIYPFNGLSGITIE